MSFLNWFSAKSRTSKSAAREEKKRGSAAATQRQAPEAEEPGDGRKVKRHARREQLYVAIREAMTRAGVLSASYKFKVLSLDSRGNEFLVMMDLAKASGGLPEQLGDIEALIVQNARARFEITVPAVYWRMDEAVAVGKPGTGSQTAAQTSTPLARGAAAASAASSTPRYEPIQADEVVAFKQALMAASAQGPGGAVEYAAKTRSGPHSYTLLTGFEDTEMASSAVSPVLSSTQYGELN
jgi:hypothetical protein